MAPNADPYRTLGLERGASLEDVKRAYRRLAKANHPDAAGEVALPRFLAIQAAYDQIAGPDARTRRPGAGRPGSAAASSRRSWEADPDRADATHRAYAGRSRTRSGTRSRPAGPPPGARPNRPPRPDRPPNKATLGSTSYDGAEDGPFDPDWGGASWYGTSSGTYWTLNPKEYADPRKHGPEYQARARRAKQPPTEAGAPASETLAADAEPGDQRATTGAAETDAPPTHSASSWWHDRSFASDRSTDPRGAEETGDPSAEAEPLRTRPRPSTSTYSAEPGTRDVSADAAVASIRAWLDDRQPPLGARIGRAVIAWAPIALGIGWIAGEVSGCSRFSADCHPAVAPLSWSAQLAVLALLIAVTRLARIGAFGTIVALAGVIPASVLLLATFDPESGTIARAALGGLMAIAWAVGVGYGVMRELRPPPIDRPVS